MKKDYSEYFRKPSLKEAAMRNKEIIINKDGLEVPAEMKNAGKDKKYFIRTYGCQGNEADSEVIAGILEFMGYKKADVRGKVSISLGILFFIKKIMLFLIKVDIILCFPCLFHVMST